MTPSPSERRRHYWRCPYYVTPQAQGQAAVMWGVDVHTACARLDVRLLDAEDAGEGRDGARVLHLPCGAWAVAAPPRPGVRKRGRTLPAVVWVGRDRPEGPEVSHG